MRVTPPRPISRVAALLAAACLVWAAGYLWEAIATPTHRGAILDANLVGATSLGGAFLEWAAMAIAFVAAVLAARTLSPTLRNAALVVGSTAAILLLGELVARVLAFGSPRVEGFPTYRSENWQRAYVRLNSRGFRDSERPGRVDDSDHLLAVIGDDYAFGWGLRDVNDRLGEQIVSDLQATTGQRWWSMNASARDRNTRQEFSFMDSVLAFRPDVVILLYDFDDIDSARGGALAGPLAEVQSPLARLAPSRVLLRNSYLVQELWARVGQPRYDGRGTTDAHSDDASLRRHLDAVPRLMAKAHGIARVALVVPLDISTGMRGDLRDRYDRFVCALVRVGTPVVSVRDALDGHDLASLRVNDLDADPNELTNHLVAAKLVPIIQDALSTGSAAMVQRARAVCGPH